MVILKRAKKMKKKTTCLKIKTFLRQNPMQVKVTMILERTLIMKKNSIQF